MDHILKTDTLIYRIGRGQGGRLTLWAASEDKVIESVPLTNQPADRFSADIDASGTVHVAVVASGALSYVRYRNKSIGTVHLMRLPESFEITSVVLNAEKCLRLNYTVKSREGSALIEYTRSGENWQGRNVYTCPEEMRLLAVTKNKDQGYGVRIEGDKRILFDPYAPQATIFESGVDIDCVQGVSAGAVWHSGGSIYYNGTEITRGKGVSVLDGKDIIVWEDSGFKRYVLSDGARLSGEAVMPKGAVEYILCVADYDKRMLISSPFPYIRTEVELKSDRGILTEVYMQQRTIFRLQQEIRGIKSQLRHLEELVKNR